MIPSRDRSQISEANRERLRNTTRHLLSQLDFSCPAIISLVSGANARAYIDNIPGGIKLPQKHRSKRSRRAT